MHRDQRLDIILKLISTVKIFFLVEHHYLNPNPNPNPRNYIELLAENLFSRVGSFPSSRGLKSRNPGCRIHPSSTRWYSTDFYFNGVSFNLLLLISVRFISSPFSRSQAPKKDKAPPPSSKPAKSGGGKQKKKVNSIQLGLGLGFVGIIPPWYLMIYGCFGSVLGILFVKNCFPFGFSFQFIYFFNEGSTFASVAEDVDLRSC